MGIDVAAPTWPSSIALEVRRTVSTHHLATFASGTQRNREEKAAYCRMRRLAIISIALMASCSPACPVMITNLCRDERCGWSLPSAPPRCWSAAVSVEPHLDGVHRLLAFVPGKQTEPSGKGMLD